MWLLHVTKSLKRHALSHLSLFMQFQIRKRFVRVASKLFLLMIKLTLSGYFGDQIENMHRYG